MDRLISKCGNVQLFNVSTTASQIMAGAGYFRGLPPGVVEFENDMAIELPEAFQKIRTSAFEVNLVFDRVYGHAKK